ncbi:DUF2061 domain-containing protein [Candidatus Woesearchaeota archaeon]|nr:DUF2061 domain-containing protein [Candidatus Woesearchaeota archaeon]
MANKKRSLVKAITFRIVATITTIILVLLITGNLALAGMVGGIDAASKFIVYYLHERVWNNIEWGKK